jgi:hypothetical protein
VQSTDGAEREGRLRLGYEPWYPSIPAGVWHDAPWLAGTVVRWWYHQPTWAMEGRVLSDAHFEFRGGAGPRKPGEERCSRRGE